MILMGDVEMGWSIPGASLVRSVVGTVVSVPGKILTKVGSTVKGGSGGAAPAQVPEPEKKGLPIPLIVGGVAAAGLLGYMLMRRRRA